MLTARNFVALTLVIAVVSLAWACLELAQPPDSGGLGGDSYGTRVQGQRGLFEILADLGIPVERILAPAHGRRRPRCHAGALETSTRPRAGGTRLSARPRPVGRKRRTRRGRPGRKTRRFPAARDVGTAPVHTPNRRSWASWGWRLCSVQTIDLKSAEKGPEADSTGRSSGGRASETATNRDESEDDDVRRIRELLTGTARPIVTRAVTVKATGVLSPLRELVGTIEVPEEKLQVLERRRVGTRWNHHLSRTRAGANRSWPRFTTGERESWSSWPRPRLPRTV